jgi:CheY-like chemotaxis protein
MAVANRSRIVVALVDDMFFGSKIRGAAEQAGTQVKFVKSAADLEALDFGLPAMIVLDLNSQKLDPIGAIEQLKSHPQLRTVPIIGFLSHIQVDLKQRAEAAGCDRVMPRSAFSLNLPDLMAGNSFEF